MGVSGSRRSSAGAVEVDAYLALKDGAATRRRFDG